MAKSVSRWVLHVSALCAASHMSAAMAEAMADPTRPPGISETASVGLVLQSILVGGGRTEAIVSGNVVKPGDQIGSARVIRITDAEVVLQNGSELQTLRLFPAIEKRLTASHGGVTAGQQRQEK